MTSRACFFNAMREDFRHKIWMLVLSILGNALAMPVAFLLFCGGSVEDPSRAISCMSSIYKFASSAYMIPALVIAIGGAVIVGLASFRYLFHRNMVDTYHSLPIKRGTLFITNWLNSFLIWFVPFIVSYLLMIFLAVIRLTQFRSVVVHYQGDLYLPNAADMVKTMTVNNMLMVSIQWFCVIVVAFTVIYHLILLAVMLSGNVLNALVVTGVLGFGIEVLLLIIYGFCGMAFDTFIGDAHVWITDYMFLSPGVSVGRMVYDMQYVESSLSLIENIVLAVLLIVAAYFVYQKRQSELSEQGLKNKPVKYFIQVLTTLCASMGGWIVFYVVSDEMYNRSGYIWGIFGAVLTGIFAYGVLNCIFYVDIKAFLKNKILLGVTVVTGIAASIIIFTDALGYDTYLPKENDIKAISIYSYNHSLDRNYYGRNCLSPDHPINQVSIENPQAAYALLSKAVYNQKTQDSYQLHTYEESGVTYWDIVDTFMVKVTLKNGKSYYRNYALSTNDAQEVYSLISTPEYLQANYELREETERPCDRIILEKSTSRNMELNLKDDWYFEDFQKQLKEAYHKDLYEHTESIIKTQGRMMCSIEFREIDNYYGWTFVDINVFEDMTYTRDVLREFGFGEYADPIDLKQISEMHVPYYGVNDVVDYTAEVEDYEVGMEPIYAGSNGIKENLSRAEMEEILAVASYGMVYNRMFGVADYMEVYVDTVDPVRRYEIYVPRNQMPKSILDEREAWLNR